MKPFHPIKLIIVAAICGTITVILFSCTTTKHIDTSQQRVDSAAEVTKLKYEQILSENNEQHKKELAEAKKTVGTFKSVPCPDVVIPPECQEDSLAKLLLQERAKRKSMENEFKVNADGSFYLKGELESVSYDFEQKSKEFNETNQKYVAAMSELENTKTELKKEQESKVKNIHRSGGLGTWWWLLIVGFIGGLVVAYRKKIFGKPILDR